MKRNDSYLGLCTGHRVDKPVTLLKVDTVCPDCGRVEKSVSDHWDIVECSICQILFNYKTGMVLLRRDGK